MNEVGAPQHEQPCEQEQQYTIRKSQANYALDTMVPSFPPRARR